MLAGYKTERDYHIKVFSLKPSLQFEKCPLSSHLVLDFNPYFGFE